MDQGPLQSYRDLRVCQEAMTFAEKCYQLTREFPKDELHGMTSQIRRSAASVPANIAEGYGRGGRGECIQYLKVTQGSLKELETHVMLSQRVRLGSDAAFEAVLAQCEMVGKMLRALIRSLQKK